MDNDDEGAPTNPCQVAIGPRQVTLARPSFERCWAVVYAQHRNLYYALGAALGLSWQAPKPPKVTLSGCGHDVLAYGEAVWGELRETGWPHSDLVRAANVAFRLVTSGVVSESEVAEHATTFRE